MKTDEKAVKKVAEKVAKLDRERIIYQLEQEIKWTGHMFGNEPVKLPTTDQMLGTCLKNQTTIMAALIELLSEKEPFAPPKSPYTPRQSRRQS